MIPSDWGRAFEVTNWLNDQTYEVLIDQQEGRHQCTCAGFQSHGHCRHVEALYALLGFGGDPCF